MKPTKEEIIKKYQEKIKQVINEIQSIQEYYESNIKYRGKDTTRKLAIFGAKTKLQILHHKIKCWNLSIERCK